MPKFKKQVRSKTAMTVIFLITLMAVFVLLSQTAFAQVSLGIEYASGLLLGTKDVREVVINIVNILLGFLGVVAIVIILYGGYLYMTSKGEPAQIEKAKRIIINAAIGLLIILIAYAVVLFIVSQLETVFVGPQGPPGPGGNVGGGALGGGVLEAVYPEPGATNVPRNTMIMVMFNEPMDINTIIEAGSSPTQCVGIAVPCGYLAYTTGSGDPLDPNIKIVNQSEGNTPLAYNEVVVTASLDQKNFVFDPIQYLGNANNYTNYSVNLADAILRANGLAAFMAGGYTWTFQVSNVLDLTPPHITDVLPVSPPDTYMNAVVQINFNEAVNVVAATIADNVVLTNDTGLGLGSGAVITGSLTVSNQFKTVEFVSDQQCLDEFGSPVVNSCGATPYCLPGNAEITALVKAALINPVNRETISPLSGLNDAAGNSLDGGVGNENLAQNSFCEVNLEPLCNLNGQPDGRPADGADQFAQNEANDNYWWQFSTNNLMDLDPPEIIEVWLEQGNQEIQESLSPDDEATLVPRNKTIKAIFDEYIMSSTLNSTNFKVFNLEVCEDNYGAAPTSVCYMGMPSSQDWPAEVCNYAFAGEGECLYPRGGFTISKNNYSSLATVNPVGTLTNVTKASLNTYNPFLDGLQRYNPRLTSDVKDMFQNCFFDPSLGYPVGP